MTKTSNLWKYTAIAVFATLMAAPSTAFARGKMSTPSHQTMSTPPREMMSYPVDDETLTSQVKQTLLADPVLKNFPIDVRSKNGLVTLDGVVNWQSEEDQALKSALQVHGVRAVHNYLRIRNVTGDFTTGG